MAGYIEIVCNIFTPEAVANGWTGLDDGFKRQVRMPPEMWNGITTDDYLRKMDRAGIERSLLIAVRAGDLNVRGSYEIPYQAIADICRAHPDRFSRLAGIDQTRHAGAARPDPGRGAIRLRRRTLVPALVRLAAGLRADLSPLRQMLRTRHPHHDAGLADPGLFQGAAASVGGSADPARSGGVDFPDLPIIGIHIGVPWTDEMIAMCWKHANIYTAGHAYAPKHWPKQYVRYADSYGSHKVLFGTDWPVIDPERAVAEVAELGLRPASHAKLMRDNALAVFTKLPR